MEPLRTLRRIEREPNLWEEMYLYSLFARKLVDSGTFSDRLAIALDA